jgi:hypothetical protein
MAPIYRSANIFLGHCSIVNSHLCRYGGLSETIITRLKELVGITSITRSEKWPSSVTSRGNVSRNEKTQMTEANICTQSRTKATKNFSITTPCNKKKKMENEPAKPRQQEFFSYNKMSLTN